MTSAGDPIMAQGSAVVLAGVLRACGWVDVAPTNARHAILAPAGARRRRGKPFPNHRRVVLSGWVARIQTRQSGANGRPTEWRTVARMGALAALWRIVRAGSSIALFPAEEATP